MSKLFFEHIQIIIDIKYIFLGFNMTRFNPDIAFKPVAISNENINFRITV